MPDRHTILADTSALIGLASCDSAYADLVFSEVKMTTSWTCFKEIRDKARSGRNHHLKQAAQRVIDYIKDSEIAYPTRVNVPSAPNAGAFNAGEKSLRIAPHNHDEFSTVILFDNEAAVLLENSQQQLEHEGRDISIEPPNFPLFLLTRRDNDEPGIDNQNFCDQSEKMLQRQGWKGAQQELLFWQYPIRC